MNKINATKEALEVSPNIYKIIRGGRANYYFQYKHLIKSVIEILDFLYKDYAERKNIVFVIPPKLNLCFIKIKVLILTFEKTESHYTHKKYAVSKLITSLQDDPQEIFGNWKETRDLHIKSYESLEKLPVLNGKKFNVDPYVAKLIGESRIQLKKLKPARLNLSKLVRDNSRPDIYEIILAGTTLTIKASHLGTFILYPNFHFDRIPFRTIEYFLINPNKKVTKSKLENENIKFATSLDELLGKMGFVGNIGKAFISSSSKTATLRNPITTQDIIDLGIDQEKLDLEVLTLNTAKS